MKHQFIPGILCTALLLTACGQQTKKEAVVLKVNPGQTVYFAKGFGCVTKESYINLMQQSIPSEKERTASLPMPPDCVLLPHKTAFRVLSAEQLGGHASIEITNSHNLGNSGGMWTAAEFVAP